MKLGMTPGVSALRKLIMRRPALKSDVGYFVCYKLLILLLSYALSPVCNSFLLSELGLTSRQLPERLEESG